MKSVTTKLVIKENYTNFLCSLHTLAAKLFFVYPKTPRFGVRYHAFFGSSTICEYGVHEQTLLHKVSVPCTWLSARESA